MCCLYEPDGVRVEIRVTADFYNEEDQLASTINLERTVNAAREFGQKDAEMFVLYEFPELNQEGCVYEIEYENLN